MRILVCIALGAFFVVGCGDKSAEGGTTGAGVTTGTPPAPATGGGTTGAAMATGDMPGPGSTTGGGMSGGVAGTYSLSQGGQTLTLMLKDDMTFEMTGVSSEGNGKGTYTHQGDKVVLMLKEMGGQPASAEDSEPETLSLGPDGSLVGPNGMTFTRS